MREDEPPAQPARPEGGLNSGKKRRTRQAIVGAARQLLEAGKVPSVPDAASAASVSRATGYRYFPSQHDLLTALMDELMGEVQKAVDALSEDDPGERLEGLVRVDYRMRSRYEQAFRTRLGLAVRERGETTEEETVPRGWRIPAIADAVEPLTSELSPEGLFRLQAALSVLVGTEAFLILKDLWNLSGEDAEDVLVWACLTLLRAARSEGLEGTPEGRASV